ncbi:hypothetical protein LMA04_02390 [Pseudescherichia vulneris]|uniref:DUF6622 family protein n=1 Tax=Pseudescherichia vulneris TaxID=566 RepID=UPI00227D0ABE|nr:DUF6622 family protein [Pseudescherichia vulneris]WAH52924.1 hypothetical protein LMA04_02390 [Pseudescherichia vulneris]
MDYLVGIIVHTPLWVWALFVYLLARGIKARQPATVKLEKLLIVPAIFLIWDIYDLIAFRPPTMGTWTMWVAGLLVGAAIGYQLINPKRIQPGSEPRSLQRPGDYSVLPLMMIAFLTKYVFAVLTAISPATMAQPGFIGFAVVSGGVFAGTFMGKFMHYVCCYAAFNRN